MPESKNHQISVYSLLSGPSSQETSEQPKAGYPTILDSNSNPNSNSIEPITKPQTFYDPIKDITYNSPKNVTSPITVHSVLKKEPTPRSNKMSLSSMMNEDSSSSNNNNNGSTPPARTKLVINDLLQSSDSITSSSEFNNNNNNNTHIDQDSNNNNKKKKGNNNKRKNDSPNQNKIKGGDRELMTGLSKPAFSDVTDSSKNNISPDQKFEPIIALNIPLVTPGTKPGQTQSIFNVMKLCEDKYGFDVMHRNGRIAFDLDEFEDDRMVDDDPPQAVLLPNSNHPVITNDEDTATGGDELKEDVLKKLKMKFKPGMNDDEKEEMILKELHRRNMENNKRIGKYDVHDPFIDDEELLFEEQTKTNKDGFFVFYGPIADESNSKDNKKKPEQATNTTIKRRKPNSTKQPIKEISNDNGVVLTVSGRPRKKPGPRSKKEKEMMALEQQKQEQKQQHVSTKVQETDQTNPTKSTTTSNNPVTASETLPPTINAPAPKTQATPIVESQPKSTSAGKPMDNQIIIGDFPF